MPLGWIVTYTRKKVPCLGCAKPIRADGHIGKTKTGFCRACYSGPNHARWKGGEFIDGKGYVLLKANSPKIKHPEYITNKAGVIQEHVYVMACKLGRPLERNENVHHKNGVKTDNRLRNLELWVSSQPAGQRVQDLRKWAKEILKRYPDGLDCDQYP